ncbi:MAG: site-2 protease family protein [bacterium]
MTDIFFIIFQLTALLLSVIVHEVAHGLMALHLGDDTAKRAGRLTLNPIKHIDPLGTLILPMVLYIMHSPVLFGWAKPVPYNPNALYKDFRYGPLKVALAGPLSNIILAAIFALIIRIGSYFLSPIMIALLGSVVAINCVLAIFNILPIPPLDGSKILTTLLPSEYARKIEALGLKGFIFVLIVLYFCSNFIFDVAMWLFYLLVGSNGFSIFIRFFSK